VRARPKWSTAGRSCSLTTTLARRYLLTAGFFLLSIVFDIPCNHGLGSPLSRRAFINVISTMIWLRWPSLLRERWEKVDVLTLFLATNFRRFSTPTDLAGYSCLSRMKYSCPSSLMTNLRRRRGALPVAKEEWRQLPLRPT
jgi:hypothetical protein